MLPSSRNSALLDEFSVLPTTEFESITSGERSRYSWTDEVLGEYDEDDERTEFQRSIQEFQELQSSMGAEVVEEQLQNQIDEAKSSRPSVFLDRYVENATPIEKVAMSAIPEQLPRPALTALAASRKQTEANSAKSSLNTSKGRITPDQEIELGKQIQSGIKLHKIKTDFEQENNREITRQEWTKLSGLKSYKELRRQVSMYRNAKQLLVSSNMGLVHAVVNKRHDANRRHEELIQEGSLGLMRAAELFDPSRGIRFSTYATIWIKGVLSNSHNDQMISLPLREKSKWKKIRDAQASLAKVLGREPTEKEIASATDMRSKDVSETTRRMTVASSVLSLDYTYTHSSRSGTEQSSAELLQLDKSFMYDADLAERAHLQADVIATLAKKLTPREERLMRLRYGLADGQARTCKECAELMGISQRRANDIDRSCLKKLREADDAQALQEYWMTVA